MPKFSLADDILVLNANIGGMMGGKMQSWKRIRTFLEWYEKINPNAQQNYQMVHEKGESAPLILPGGMHIQPGETFIRDSLGGVDLLPPGFGPNVGEYPGVIISGEPGVQIQPEIPTDTAPHFYGGRVETVVTDPSKQQIDYSATIKGPGVTLNERAKYLTDSTERRGHKGLVPCPALNVEHDPPLTCLLYENHEGGHKFHDQRSDTAELLKRIRSLEAVGQEIERQTSLKASGRFQYTVSDPEMNDFERLAVLGEEFGEVSHEVNETIGNHRSLDILRIKKELIQVAAVAVAWFERY